jgi:hypothetical protein
MRSVFLSAVLGVLAFGCLSGLPSKAQAWHWQRRTVVVVPAPPPVVTTSYYVPPVCLPGAPPPSPLPVLTPAPTPVGATVIIRERPRILFPNTTTVIVRP